MSAGKSFTLAAKKKLAPEPNGEYDSRSYTFESEAGKKRTIIANYPGDGVMTMLIAASGGGLANMTAEVFRVVDNSFSREDARYLRQLVANEELTVDQLMEIVKDMVEGWTAFPTQPSSDSEPSPSSTGQRSTGRVRGKGSTS